MNRRTEILRWTLIDTPPGLRYHGRPDSPPPCNPGRPCEGFERVASFVYDTVANGVGRLVSFSNQSGSTTFTLDALGRAEHTEKSVLGKTYDFAQEFDLAGNVTSITYPDGEQVAYYYNRRGLVSSVVGDQTYLSSILYNAHGQPVSEVAGNGVQTVRTFSAATGYLERVRVERQATPLNALLDRTYGYDLAGLVTSTAENATSGAEQYSYDDLHRLTLATRQAGSSVFAYDLIGNITAKNGLTLEYGDALHPSRLTSTSDAEVFTHDENGNVTNDGRNSYFFNDLNQLEWIARLDGSNGGRYVYDAMGSRVAKLAPAAAEGGCNGGEAASCELSTSEESSVGSSRVDLQACKLEYSIVSPK